VARCKTVQDSDSADLLSHVLFDDASTPDVFLAPDKTDSTHDASRTVRSIRKALVPAHVCACPGNSIDRHAQLESSGFSKFMPQTSYSKRTGNLISWLGARIMLAILLLAAWQFAIRFYLTQEIFVVLLLVALSMMVILVIAVAFVLFQEGIRRAILWGKIGFVRLARLSHRHVSPPESIIHPPLPR
jgi:hypothetical protein